MKRIVFCLCVAVSVFSVAMQTQTKAPQAGPEYNVLDAWAGDWTIQLDAKDSPSGPAYKIDCALKGQRILGGYFLEIRHVWKVKGIDLNGVEIMGYDPIKKTCLTHIFFDDGSWTSSTIKFINARTAVDIGASNYPDGTVSKWKDTWDFSPDWMSCAFKEEQEKDGTWWTSIEGKGVRPQAKY